MKRVLLLFCLLTSGVLAQSAAETKVLGRVKQLLSERGRVTFSELYNSPELSPEEKAFLGRLYEMFFTLPGYLKTEFEASQRVPSRKEIAASFGIALPSVDLLLTVMERDSRMPSLFTRDTESGEILSLNRPALDAFVNDKGRGARVTNWVGSPLPAFQVKAFDGRVIRNSDLTGRNTLLYFWFTGCPPCVRIAPILAELDQKYGSGKVRFVGLNADELLEIESTLETRKAYVEKQGINFTNADLASDAREAFGNVNVFPTLFLVDQQGVIVRHFINFQTRETLEAAIVELLSAE